jgi:hypothetical protein
VAVTEIRQALGSWELTLKEGTPADVLDAVTPFGHIAIVPGRMTEGDIQAAGDNLLTAARYVGVYRSREAGGTDNRTTLRGAGMAFWLGDEDGKGYVYESTLTASGTFSVAASAILAPNVPTSVGTLTAVPGDGGAFLGRFIYQTPREALTYLTDTYSSDTVPVGWRVNGNGSVDAGPESALYRTTPVAMLVQRDEPEGRDLAVIGMRGNLDRETDLADYTTRVLLLAEGEEGSTATGSASFVSAYKDIRGNAVKMTRIVSEDLTAAGTAASRATLQLNRFKNPRYAVTLDTTQYDVKGEFGVGDTIMLFDPANGFLDLAREVAYRGTVINPMYVQCTEMTWPVPDGWTVAFRDGNGVWTDLSAHYVPEGGATNVVVGQFSRDILANSYQQIGTRPTPDFGIPATPTFSASATSAYLSALTGTSDTKAVIQLQWGTPLNTDGSTIVDGDHYEVRWRPVTIAPYPATHLQMASKLHNQLLTHQQPLIPAITNTQWRTEYIAWGSNTVAVSELTPGVSYEFQIRAVDTASPPNQSAFSASWTIPAALDNLAPSQPAAPEVAGNLASVQITHRLGTNAGGTFNLEPDLDHLEIHVSGDPTFTPDQYSYVGKLQAGVAQLRANIPVIGTFPITPVDTVQVKVIAVDRTGNRSLASPAAGISVVLIDSAHISDLTASKITAGTISVNILNAGRITTALSGPRAEMSASGFFTYLADGTQAFGADSSGNVTLIGTVTTGASGRRIQMNPSGGQGQIRFYNTNNGDYALIDTRSYSGGAEAGIFARSSLDENNNYFGTLWSQNQWRAGYLNPLSGASGGLFYADKGQAIIGHYPGDIQQSNLITYSIDADPYFRLAVWDNAGTGLLAGIRGNGANRWLRFYGNLIDSVANTVATNEIFIAGSFTTVSASSFTLAWGPTMDNAPKPLFSLRAGTAAAHRQYKMTAYSTTNFTVQQSITDVVEITWMGVRVT